MQYYSSSVESASNCCSINKVARYVDLIVVLIVWFSIIAYIRLLSSGKLSMNFVAHSLPLTIRTILSNSLLFLSCQN